MSLGSDVVTGDDTAAIQAEYSVISINLVAVRTLCRTTNMSRFLGLRNLQ